MNDLIMIVEDDPYISHFLQMSFEQEGCGFRKGDDDQK